MKIKELTSIFEQAAPLALQESYDNCGLAIGDPTSEITSALITLDVTEEVVDEAIKLGANLIISHHPVIFQGLKSLNGKNAVERIVLKAIKNDIALYAGHTNFDNIDTGVNKVICNKLGLENCKILAPQTEKLVKLVTFVPTKEAQMVRNAIFEAGAGVIGKYDCCSYNIEGQGTFRAGNNTDPYVGEKNTLHTESEIRIETILPTYMQSKVVSAMTAAHPYEEVAYDIYPLANTFNTKGSGMFGDLENPISAQELLDRLKNVFHAEGIRYAGDVTKPIKRIAVCGGSGSFLINNAIKRKADAFITAEVKYHQFLDHHKQLLICDIGHFESEQYTKELFYELVKENFPTFAVHLSEIKTNPIKYFK